jgi:hypothetical protein
LPNSHFLLRSSVRPVVKRFPAEPERSRERSGKNCKPGS